MQEDRPIEATKPTSPPDAEAAPAEADDWQQAGPENAESHDRDAPESRETAVSPRRIALYAGLFVLALQLLYVYSFFPTYDEAVVALEGTETAIAVVR